MVKEKKDYPIVLTTRHVKEMMNCSEPTARVYIKTANARLKQEGKIPCLEVANIARVPRDYFFNMFGI
jgi:hypothetical protein